MRFSILYNVHCIIVVSLSAQGLKKPPNVHYFDLSSNALRSHWELFSQYTQVLQKCFFFCFFLKQGVVDLLNEIINTETTGLMFRAKSGVEESSVLVTIFLSAKLDTIVECLHHVDSPIASPSFTISRR